MKIALVALAASASLGALSPTPGQQASTAEWKVIEPPLETSFPRDHGRHDEYRTEWWYATGILESTASGERIGWQLTIFRQGIEPGPPAASEPLLTPRTVYAGHLVLVDVTTGRTLQAERVRRAVPALAAASATDLDVVLDGWTMKRAPDDTLHAVARDRDRGIAIDLVLHPLKTLVMHGAERVSVKGEGLGNASAYMSWTRLATTGSITIDGRTRDVRGESWFDHEWATSQLSRGVVGWDWFGLRLDDGRELMLYRLRRADGSAIPQSAGTLVEHDGTTRNLSASDFTLEATSTWKSPRTQGVYPSGWRLRVPSVALDVTLASEVDDCEIDARASTSVIYWEGPVRVAGSISGSGYGELTGYAGSLEERF